MSPRPLAAPSLTPAVAVRAPVILRPALAMRATAGNEVRPVIKTARYGIQAARVGRRRLRDGWGGVGSGAGVVGAAVAAGSTGAAADRCTAVWVALAAVAAFEGAALAR
jgi:hypothetical protein